MKQFSIRDLLLLVAIAAVGLGWRLDHFNLVTINQASEDRVLTAEAIVETREAILDIEVPSWRDKYNRITTQNHRDHK